MSMVRGSRSSAGSGRPDNSGWEGGGCPSPVAMICSPLSMIGTVRLSGGFRAIASCSDRLAMTVAEKTACCMSPRAPTHATRSLMASACALPMRIRWTQPPSIRTFNARATVGIEQPSNSRIVSRLTTTIPPLPGCMCRIRQSMSSAALGVSLMSSWRASIARISICAQAMGLPTDCFALSLTDFSFRFTDAPRADHEIVFGRYHKFSTKDHDVSPAVIHRRITAGDTSPSVSH